jgi:uncharacterized protein
METDEARCAEARKFQRIDDAFRAGNLDALRAALDDPAAVPNGPMPAPIGNCLVYAIYHSPRPFIRQLLQLGADPNAPVDDGFPPLLAALSCTTVVPGARRREDVNDVIRLLLRSGCNPNQRGINDWTPLHMAVAQRNTLALQLLLDAGADPDARTRIDACDTALEMARAADHSEAEAILARRGAPLDRRLRSGLTLLLDVPGQGDLVVRQQSYRMRLRLWLNRGEPFNWGPGWGSDSTRTEDEGEVLVTPIRVSRGSMMNGLFYGIEGMRVGGTRRLRISSHLAYGSAGLGERIPPGAVLTAEVTIEGERA